MQFDNKVTLTGLIQIVGVAFTVVCTVMVFYWSTGDRLNRIEVQGQGRDESIEVLNARIIELEKEGLLQNFQIKDIDNKLERINTNIERLLEKMNHDRPIDQ